MILIYNVPGLLMLLGAGAVAFLVNIGLGSTDAGTKMSALGAIGAFAAITMIVDLVYRLRQPEQSTGRKLFSPNIGGMLYWIPIWLIGGVGGFALFIAFLMNAK